MDEWNFEWNVVAGTPEQAYELWDHAGRPDGRSDEFWFAARAEFEREEETGEGNLGAHVPPHADPSRHEQ